MNKIGDIFRDSGAQRSPLLELRWLRLVVDEGHALGAHSASLGAADFISEIAAERRWVLSGTPTTGDQQADDVVSDSLQQIQRLLSFLRHPRYGRSSSLVEGLDDTDAISVDQATRRDAWATEVVELSSSHTRARARAHTHTRARARACQVVEPFVNRLPIGRQRLVQVLKNTYARAHTHT